jgi:hypothetical protein
MPYPPYSPAGSKYGMERKVHTISPKAEVAALSQLREEAAAVVARLSSAARKGQSADRSIGVGRGMVGLQISA